MSLVGSKELQDKAAVPVHTQDKVSFTLYSTLPQLLARPLHHFSLELTGEASASTMWDNQAWSYLHGDKEEAEPLLLAQDFIHTLQPNAKIIVMLRDPVER